MRTSAVHVIATPSYTTIAPLHGSPHRTFTRCAQIKLKKHLVKEGPSSHPPLPSQSTLAHTSPSGLPKAEADACVDKTTLLLCAQKHGLVAAAPAAPAKPPADTGAAEAAEKKAAEEKAKALSLIHI